MLYAQSAPGRWLSNLTMVMDDAAAGICRVYWRQGRSLEPRPLRSTPRSRPAR